MDEKGFFLGVVKKLYRVFNRYAWESGKLTGAGHTGDRTWITVVASICMDGSYLPPTVIYPSKSELRDTLFNGLDPLIHKLHFTWSATGWTNDEIGAEWLINVFDRWTKRKARLGRDPRLLIIDSYGSYISI